MDEDLLAQMEKIGPVITTEQTKQAATPDVPELVEKAGPTKRSLPKNRSKVEPRNPEEEGVQAGRLTEVQAMELLRIMREGPNDAAAAALAARETGLSADQLATIAEHLQFPRIVYNSDKEKFTAYEPLDAPRAR